MPPTSPHRPVPAARRPAHPVSRAASAAAAALLLALTPSLSHAGDVWDGGSAVDSNWTTAANWNPDGAPANDGTRHLVFSGGNRLFPNVNTPYSVASLTFFSTTGSFTIGGTTLTLGAGGIANNDTEGQTISAPLVVGADQTWSAASGSLSVGSVSLGANDLTTGGAQLVAIGGAVTSASSAATLTVAGGTTRLGGATANTMSGTWFVNAGTLELDKSGTDNAIRSPLVIGDGFGIDTVRLLRATQIATTAGTSITINASGVLDLNGFSETAPAITLNGGQITTGAGTLALAGGLTSSAGATQTSTVAGNVSLNVGTSVWDVGESAATDDLAVSAAISNGSLVKNGAGWLVFDGTAVNTYTGTTTVNAGVLELNRTGAGANNAVRGDLVIGDGVGGVGADTVQVFGQQISGAAGSVVRIESSGTLDVRVSPEDIADLRLVGGRVTTTGASARLIVNGSITTEAHSQSALISGPIEFGTDLDALNAATVTVADGTASSDLDVAAGISGKSFIKTGPGTMRLSGTSSNTIAAIMVSDGTLSLAKSSSASVAAAFLDVSGTGVVSYAANHQVPDSGELRVSGTGQINLGSRADDVNLLAIRDGSVTLSSSGTLGILTGIFVPGGPTATATISGGTVIGRTAVLTITASSASGPEPDLAISSVLAGNTIKKVGSGAIRLSGSSPNTFAELDFDAGRIHLAKTSGIDAIPAVPVTVGGSNGASLVWESDEQIADAASVTLLPSGILNLDGHTETFANLTVAGGNIFSPGTLVVAPGGIFNQSSGSNSASVVNYGTHNYSGGAATRALVNEGTMNINADFTGHFDNRNAVNIAAGRAAVATEQSVNYATIQLNSATLQASGTFTNNGTITGRGTLSALTFGAFTNLGAILPTGPLTVSAANTGGFANAGDITLPTGIQLTVAGNGLNNTGTITLAGGALSSSSTLTNAPGGVIAGRGSVSNTTGSFANAGGVIRPVDGTLSFNQSFTSTGLVDLRNGTVAGPGTLTNQGRITGNGTISKPLANPAAGRIEPAGHLTVGTNLANAGTIALPAGATLYLPLGSSNAGTISLAGGTYDNNNLPLNNTGQLTGFGTLATGGLTNNGTVTLTGGLSILNGSVLNAAAKTFKVQHNAAIFTGTVVNNGSFQVINTTATFAGGFTGTAPSEPSALAVDPTGSLLASFVAQSSLTNSGHISLRPKSDGGDDSTVGSLTLLPGSTFDLVDNDLTVLSTAASTIRQYLFDHRLTSSAPDPDDLLTLAYSHTTPTLVTLTYHGDANLNGTLDPDDFALLDRGFLTGGTLWHQGDFNHDGSVTLADYLLIDRTFGQAQGFSPGFLAQRGSQFGASYVSQLLTSIPEPTTALAPAAILFLAIHRRPRGIVTP